VCDILCKYTSSARYGFLFIPVEHFRELRISVSTASCSDYHSSQAASECEEHGQKSPSLKSWKSNWKSFSCAKKSYCWLVAAFGPDTPEVLTLRDFRDDTLTKTDTGRQLIDLYYRYSPALIRLLKANPGLGNYAMDRLTEISALIDSHLYGDGIGEGEYEYVRSIIEEGIDRLGDLSLLYGSDPGHLTASGEQQADNEIRSLLTDETLAEINVLIQQLLDELSGQDEVQYSNSRQSAGE